LRPSQNKCAEQTDLQQARDSSHMKNHTFTAFHHGRTEATATIATHCPLARLKYEVGPMC